jgi:hypothetical protein
MASVERFVSFQFRNLRESVGFHGRGISPKQGRYLQMTTQTQNKCRQISTPCVGFQPMIWAFKWAKTVHASDLVVTVIGFVICLAKKSKSVVMTLSRVLFTASGVRYFLFISPQTKIQQYRKWTEVVICVINVFIRAISNRTSRCIKRKLCSLCYEIHISRILEFEVLTTVKKSYTLWDITPRSPLRVSRRFGGKFHVQLQRGTACCLFHAAFLHGSFFDPEDGGEMFIWNVGLLPTDYTALYPSSSVVLGAYRLIPTNVQVL